MYLTGKMLNDIARLSQKFSPRNAVASDWNIGYIYIYTHRMQRKKEKKRYHPCVSESKPRSRVAAEVEE